MRFLPADGNDGDQNVAESSYGNQGYEERERDKGEVCLDSRWTMLDQLNLRGHFEILDFAMILLAGNRSFESSSFFFLARESRCKYIFARSGKRATSFGRLILNSPK